MFKPTQETEMNYRSLNKIFIDHVHGDNYIQLHTSQIKQRRVDFPKAVVWEYPGKYFVFYTEEVELTNFGRNLFLRCLWSAKKVTLQMQFKISTVF